MAIETRFAGSSPRVAPEPTRGPHDRWLLAAILALALGVRVYVIWTQQFVIHADETFQYLEQAHRLAFGDGVVPWEFIDGARSWLVPGIISGLMRMAAWFSNDPLSYLRFIRLCAAAIALTPVYIGFRLGQRTGGTIAAVLTGTLCAVWFELIYFAPLILTEVFSTHAALWALYLNITGERPKRLAWAGALFALAICLRVQNGPALLGAMLWLNRADWRRWRWLIAGGLPVALALGGVLDTVTLGLPFQSIWLNIYRNIWQGVGASNGLEPIIYYPHWIWWMWRYALIIAVFAAAGAVRVPALAIAAAITLAVHSFIGHKEYRFIYLALAVMPILAGIGMAWLSEWLSRFLKGRPGPGYVAAALLASAAAVSCYAGTHDVVARRWSQGRPRVQALLAAHAQADLCGLGIKELAMFDSGGYAYLHRDVPLFFDSYSEVHHLRGTSVPFRTIIVFHNRTLEQYPGPAMASNTARFNYLIAPPGDAYPSYDPVACFANPAAPDPPETCLFRRPGPCR